ncbi:putative SNARE domain protein [Cryptosporidium felis]|nr:putative SNARE domain protein [Cryptosporidium felis]
MSSNFILNEQNDPQKQELKELRKECEEVIRSTLKMAANANEISRFSATKLNEQSEQLHRIENETEKIKDNLNKTEDAISSLKNPLLFWFKGLFKQGKPLIKDKINQDIKKPVSISQPKGKKNSGCDNKGSIGQFDDEIDQGLDEISDILREMQDRAIEINTTLKDQSSKMERININVDDNNSRMKNQRRELGRFIGK